MPVRFSYVHSYIICGKLESMETAEVAQIKTNLVCNSVWCICSTFKSCCISKCSSCYNMAHRTGKKSPHKPEQGL